MKECDDSKVLTGIIQLDDAYWGGEHHGGKREHSSPNKTPFVAALSVNDKQSANVECGHIGRSHWS